MARKKSEPVVLTAEQVMEQEVNKYFTNTLSWCDKSIIPSPTRYFEVGEEVKVGNINKSIIVQVLDDGIAYLVEAHKIHKNIVTIDYHVWHWFAIDKKDKWCDKNAPILQSKWELPQSMRTNMSHFIYGMSNHGLVCDPRFQREYVWTQGDVDALFDSMFDNMEIGLFIVYENLGYLHQDRNETFTYRNFDGNLITIKKNRDYVSSIIDGQQRLTTIFKFITGKVLYRGKRFDELHPSDQSHIENYRINVATFTEGRSSEKDLYRAFLLCNNSGVPMREEHIAKVREQYNKLKGE